ncbi:MAG: phosphohistidine phosphatase SixA [Verrucomicrobia bacterium]|nr:phosphohistidine phosphatase SixA [Verrucomicrobiota bacterium]
MHLYLFRHAHAEEGSRDALRPLSPKGLRQVRVMGQWLRDARAVEAAEIWHSPLRRAAETAALLSRRLRLKVPLVEVTGLKPQDDPEVILRRLKLTENPVALVGHDPHLSALASLLVAGAAHPPRFRLKKCAAMRLDLSGEGWCVRWQISPELL